MNSDLCISHQDTVTSLASWHLPTREVVTCSAAGRFVLLWAKSSDPAHHSVPSGHYSRTGVGAAAHSIAALVDNVVAGAWSVLDRLIGGAPVSKSVILPGEVQCAVSHPPYALHSCLVHGHTVTCVRVWGSLLATAAEDGSVSFWCVEGEVGGELVGRRGVVRLLGRVRDAHPGAMITSMEIWHNHLVSADSGGALVVWSTHQRKRNAAPAGGKARAPSSRDSDPSSSPGTQHLLMMSRGNSDSDVQRRGEAALVRRRNLKRRDRIYSLTGGMRDSDAEGMGGPEVGLKKNATRDGGHEGWVWHLGVHSGMSSAITSLVVWFDMLCVGYENGNVLCLESMNASCSTKASCSCSPSIAIVAAELCSVTFGVPVDALTVWNVHAANISRKNARNGMEEPDVLDHGSLLCVGTHDGSIVLCEWSYLRQCPTLVTTLQHHSFPLCGLAAAGEMLCSASVDGDITLWHKNGVEIGSVCPTGAEARRPVCVVTHANQLFSGWDDGAVYVHQLGVSRTAPSHVGCRKCHMIGKEITDAEERLETQLSSIQQSMGRTALSNHRRKILEMDIEKRRLESSLFEESVVCGGMLATMASTCADHPGSIQRGLEAMQRLVSHADMGIIRSSMCEKMLRPYASVFACTSLPTAAAIVHIMSLTLGALLGIEVHGHSEEPIMFLEDGAALHFTSNAHTEESTKACVEQMSEEERVERCVRIMMLISSLVRERPLCCPSQLLNGLCAVERLCPFQLPWKEQPTASPVQKKKESKKEMKKEMKEAKKEKELRKEMKEGKKDMRDSKDVQGDCAHRVESGAVTTESGASTDASNPTTPSAPKKKRDRARSVKGSKEKDKEKEKVRGISSTASTGRLRRRKKDPLRTPLEAPNAPSSQTTSLPDIAPADGDLTSRSVASISALSRLASITLEWIFKQDLSAKFWHSGVLDCDDLIRNGFHDVGTRLSFLSAHHLSSAMSASLANAHAFSKSSAQSLNKCTSCFLQCTAVIVAGVDDGAGQVYESALLEALEDYFHEDTPSEAPRIVVPPVLGAMMRRTGQSSWNLDSYRTSTDDDSVLESSDPDQCGAVSGLKECGCDVCLSSLSTGHHLTRVLPTLHSHVNMLPHLIQEAKLLVSHSFAEESDAVPRAFTPVPLELDRGAASASIPIGALGGDGAPRRSPLLPFASSNASPSSFSLSVSPHTVTMDGTLSTSPLDITSCRDTPDPFAPAMASPSSQQRPAPESPGGSGSDDTSSHDATFADEDSTTARGARSTPVARKVAPVASQSSPIQVRSTTPTPTPGAAGPCDSAEPAAVPATPVKKHRRMKSMDAAASVIKGLFSSDKSEPSSRKVQPAASSPVPRSWMDAGGGASVDTDDTHESCGSAAGGGQSLPSDGVEDFPVPETWMKRKKSSSVLRARIPLLSKARSTGSPPSGAPEQASPERRLERPCLRRVQDARISLREKVSRIGGLVCWALSGVLLEHERAVKQAKTAGVDDHLPTGTASTSPVSPTNIPPSKHKRKTSWGGQKISGGGGAGSSTGGVAGIAATGAVGAVPLSQPFAHVVEQHVKEIGISLHRYLVARGERDPLSPAAASRSSFHRRASSHEYTRRKSRRRRRNRRPGQDLNSSTNSSGASTPREVDPHPLQQLIPLGLLRIGTRRHRALLFKVLCDSVGIESRVVRSVAEIGSDPSKEEACAGTHYNWFNIVNFPEVVNGMRTNNWMMVDVMHPVVDLETALSSAAGEPTTPSRTAGPDPLSSSGSSPTKHVCAVTGCAECGNTFDYRVHGYAPLLPAHSEQAQVYQSTPSLQAEQEMAIIRWSAVQSKDAFEVGEVIGKSNFDVREAKLTGFGVKCDFALKEIPLFSPTSDEPEEKQRERAVHEANLYCQLRHPNVTEFRHAFLEKGVLYIVMERMDTDLKRVLQGLARSARASRLASPTPSRGGRADGKSGGSVQAMAGSCVIHPVMVLSYLIDVARALAYLHRNNVLYRDMKPANVLLCRQRNWLKLADFGMSKQWLESNMEKSASWGGTRGYIAPELLVESFSSQRVAPITNKIDVYSFGRLLGIMAIGCASTKEFSMDLLSERAPHLVQLYAMCTARNPSERPAFDAIVDMLVELLIRKLTEEGDEGA